MEHFKHYSHRVLLMFGLASLGLLFPLQNAWAQG
jgi:hypothetical protein